MRTFHVTKLTMKKGGGIPTLPFLRMKECVLGKHYALSLVVAGDAYARKLNRLYRKKSYIPNVLAFPLERGVGEIILSMAQAKRECAVREASFRFFVALLFVHALLHLKGCRHGRIMERQERALLSKFHINNTFRTERRKGVRKI
ncbi:MAG: rRNA maturation RNase YbeY [bacterium]|nr:rRNA maturation RNase YbeY [bacterium]